MIRFHIFLSALILVACDSTQSPKAVVSQLGKIEVVRILPHDPGAFTQGLLVWKNHLYESTGLYGKSSWRRLDKQSGEQLSQVNLGREFFGEGLAQLGNRLFQLTWKEEKLFVWDIESASLLHSVPYSGEGWGLTTVGPRFLMSNGSDTLYERDSSFTILRRIPVTFQGKALPRLNELEWYKGFVLANIWQSDTIVAIDPGTGGVRWHFDASFLRSYQRDRPMPGEVLNGIAYDPDSDQVYLTGKLWPRLFVTRLHFQ